MLLIKGSELFNDCNTKTTFSIEKKKTDVLGQTSLQKSMQKKGWKAEVLFLVKETFSKDLYDLLMFPEGWFVVLQSKT